MWGRAFILGVSHASYPERAEFHGFPIFGVLLYLRADYIFWTQATKFGTITQYGEFIFTVFFYILRLFVRKFSLVTPLYLRWSSRSLSATAEILALIRTRSGFRVFTGIFTLREKDKFLGSAALVELCDVVYSPSVVFFVVIFYKKYRCRLSTYRISSRKMSIMSTFSKVSWCP